MTYRALKILPFIEGQDEEGARKRADKFYRKDPFPDVPPALLSSEHIREYARVTAFLHPFREDALKSASYEAHIGGQFIYWDETGKKIAKAIQRGDDCVLPANSISFVQVEPIFRLPNYIALRFNLRITHVHRGLLLGTGPLVDPGFRGKLLIPLHNLTSANYNIDTEKALIWIEFTKTTFGFNINGSKEPDNKPENFRHFPKQKWCLSPNTYLHKASAGNPIRSSIPDSVSEATKMAESAKKYARFLAFSGFGLGVIAVVGVVYGGYTLVTDTVSISAQNSKDIGEYKSNYENIESEMNLLKEEIRSLRQQLGNTNSGQAE